MPGLKTSRNPQVTRLSFQFEMPVTSAIHTAGTRALGMRMDRICCGCNHMAILELRKPHKMFVWLRRSSHIRLIGQGQNNPPSSSRKLHMCPEDKLLPQPRAFGADQVTS